MLKKDKKIMQRTNKFPDFPISLFPYFLISMLFISCEKVVYIDLNTSDPHPVVEANITNQAGPYTVKLSRSVNYYDANIFPAITDATVTISDNSGNSEILKQTSDGIYQTSTTQGIPGRTYSLKILFNGKEYKDELVDLKISDLTGTRDYRSRMLLSKAFMAKANIVIDPSKEFNITNKKEIKKKKTKKNK